MWYVLDSLNFGGAIKCRLKVYCSVPTIDGGLRLKVAWLGASHVHSNVVGHGRGDDLKDVGRGERVHLWVDHGVHGKNVCQLHLLVVVRGGVGLVQGEALGVQPPVVLLALRRERGGGERGRGEGGGERGRGGGEREYM